MEKLVAVVAGVDTKVWIVLGVVLAVLAILAIVKKAIKLGIVVLVAAFILGGGGGVISNVTSQYNIKYADGVIEATFAGEPYSIPVSAIERVKVVDGEDKECEVIVEIKGGAHNSFELPSILKGVVKNVAEDAGVEYVEAEQ